MVAVLAVLRPKSPTCHRRDPPQFAGPGLLGCEEEQGAWPCAMHVHEGGSDRRPAGRRTERRKGRTRSSPPAPAQPPGAP